MKARNDCKNTAGISRPYFFYTNNITGDIAEVLKDAEKEYGADIETVLKNISDSGTTELEIIRAKNSDMKYLFNSVFSAYSDVEAYPEYESAGDILHHLKIFLRDVSEFINRKNSAEETSENMARLTASLKTLGSVVYKLRDEVVTVYEKVILWVYDVLKYVQTEVGIAAITNQNIIKYVKDVYNVINNVVDMSMFNWGDIPTNLGNPIDSFGEINVYVSDKELIDLATTRTYGCACMRMYSGSVYGLQWGDGIKTVDIQKRTIGNVIFISEGIADIKKSHPNWYNYILYHELGHVLTNFYFDVCSYARDGNYRYCGNETISDLLGYRASGFDRTEFCEYVNWASDIEVPRLYGVWDKIIKEYRFGKGIRTTLPELQSMWKRNHWLRWFSIKTT